MLPGNATALAPKRTYRPGSFETAATVSLPDLGVEDIDVEVVVDWDADGEWAVSEIRIPNVSPRVCGRRRMPQAPAADLSRWARVADLKANNGPLPALHRLYLLRLADAAEWVIDDAVIAAMDEAA